MDVPAMWAEVSDGKTVDKKERFSPPLFSPSGDSAAKLSPDTYIYFYLHD